MSFTDHFNPHPIRGKDPQTRAVGPQAVAVDGELKALLQQMAGQMADAERRHGEAMRDMQVRLDRLAADAQQARGAAPAAAVPSIARIENGVADLAGRMAEVGRDRLAHRTAIDDQHPGAATVDVIETRVLARQPSVADAPAPLRSALSALDSALQSSDAGFGAVPPSISDAALSRSVARDPTEPWDQEQADALSQLYEMEAAGARPRRPEVFFPEPVGAQPTPAPAFAPAPPVASVAGLGDDKAWLDTKFSEIARGIERQLTETLPDNALLVMGTRLDQLESRFGSALSGVAQRADLASLGEIERQIGDMAAQFERTERQLARLDVLEWQLKEMSGHITTLGDQQAASAHNHSMFAQQHANFVEQHADFVARQVPTAQARPEPVREPDYQAIADAAAERVAARLAAMSVHAEPAPTTDLEAMMQGYISERRRGDEHTAMALDTVQEALARLIDRVDQFEVQPEPQASAQFRQTAGAHGATLAPPPPEPEPIDQPAPAFGRRPALPPAHSYAELEVPDRHDPAPIEAAKPPMQRNTLHSLKDFEAAALRARAKASIGAARAGANAPVAAANDPAPEPIAAAGRGSAMRPALLIATVCCVLFGAGLMLFTFAKPGQLSKSETRVVPQSAQPMKAALPQGASNAERPERAQPPLPMRPAADSQPAGRPIAGQPAAAQPERAAKPEVLEPLLPSPSRERTVPDTVNDDLSQDATQPAAAPAVAELAKPRMPPGISVQAPTNRVNVQELMRIQQRQRLAAASSRLGAMQVGRPFAPIGAIGDAAGEAQVAQQPAPQPVPVPQPAVRAQPVSANAIPASATIEAETETAKPSESVVRPSSGLDMPPAMIGPMSLRLAAAKGDPSAEFEVAARFAEGKGVPQDFQQANVWYQRSAARGFAPAQYRLGTLYERGMAVPLDAARAKVWYKRAAEQGHVKAMHNLAVLMAGNDSKVADYETASTWFISAADRGLADSQFNLAVLYENGLGVVRDARQAYRWYALAARAGDKEAAKRRDAVRAKLDGEDIKAAEQMIAAYRPRSVDTQVNDARAAGDAWRTRADQPQQPPMLVQAPQQVTQPAAKLRP